LLLRMPLGWTVVGGLRIELLAIQIHSS
jgi:hypothetical protein